MIATGEDAAEIAVDVRIVDAEATVEDADALSRAEAAAVAPAEAEAHRATAAINAAIRAVRTDMDTRRHAVRN